MATAVTATNYASALSTAFSKLPVMYANSYALTKNITYFPYLYFDFSQSSFLPTAQNPPTQALLTIFSVAGTMPYYNLSVYPVQPGVLDGWTDTALSFATLQNGMPSTSYTYNQAGYAWPYSPGLGGLANCPLQASLPTFATACQPINSTTVSGGVPGFVSIDVTGYMQSLFKSGGVTNVDFSLVVSCWNVGQNVNYACSPQASFYSADYIVRAASQPPAPSAALTRAAPARRAGSTARTSA